MKLKFPEKMQDIILVFWVFIVFSLQVSFQRQYVHQNICYPTTGIQDRRHNNQNNQIWTLATGNCVQISK